jgi:carboxylesterase type B
MAALMLLLAVRAFTKDVAFRVVYTPSIVYTKAAVRAPEECEKDLLLDLYEPANKDKQRPAVVLMHGGALSKGRSHRCREFR